MHAGEVVPYQSTSRLGSPTPFQWFPMKTFNVHIDIDLPRDRVIELFDDRDNLFKWQIGLQSFEHVSGEPGQVGAKSRMVYDMGGQMVELTETITKRDLPHEFNGYYDWDGGRNSLINRFIETGPNSTRWESVCDYQFNGLMMKLMGFFFPGIFRRQNLKFMHNFKRMAEHGEDIRETGQA